MLLGRGAVANCRVWNLAVDVGVGMGVGRPEKKGNRDTDNRQQGWLGAPRPPWTPSLGSFSSAVALIQSKHSSLVGTDSGWAGVFQGRASLAGRAGHTLLSDLDSFRGQVSGMRARDGNNWRLHRVNKDRVVNLAVAFS